MKESLYGLWLDNRRDLVNVISKGEKVFFNGKNFSDGDLFTKGEYYNVLEVESLGIKVEGDDCYVFIYPDGLHAFEKAR